MEVVEAEAGLSNIGPPLSKRGSLGSNRFRHSWNSRRVAMNAGAWGAELKDVLFSMTLMKESGEIIERPRSRLRFSYRRLALPPSWIILKGRFQLKKGNKEEILEQVKSYSKMRKRTQPLEYPSAGSIFKNPKEGPAGKWIEEAGMKGFQVGQAMVSDRHANFIINLGKAKAEEVIRLMEWVEKKVYEEKGIFLEREVKVVGES
jgi:UDP-N-acetylmuramate dehydrogenase